MDLGKFSLCRMLLSPLRETLLKTYPDDRRLALTTMHALGRLWRADDPSQIVASVGVVQEGVSKWLKDEMQLNALNVFSEMVSPALHLTDSTSELLA